MSRRPRAVRSSPPLARIQASLREVHERADRALAHACTLQAQGQAARPLLKGEALTDPAEPPWLPTLRAELQQLAQTVRETADVLGLPVREGEVERRRRTGAWASSWWASILDCRLSGSFGLSGPGLLVFRAFRGRR